MDGRFDARQFMFMFESIEGAAGAGAGVAGAGAAGAGAGAVLPPAGAGGAAGVLPDSAPLSSAGVALGSGVVVAFSPEEPHFSRTFSRASLKKNPPSETTPWRT